MLYKTTNEEGSTFTIESTGDGTRYRLTAACDPNTAEHMPVDGIGYVELTQDALLALSDMLRAYALSLVVD